MPNKNSISLLVATAVGLGAIIGAGIFVLSGTAIAIAGANALLAFILVGIVAIFVALELGELGSIMPHAKGASYSYVYNAFGSELGFITGVVLYFSYATELSAISLGFGSYVSSILGLSVSAFAIDFAILLIVILTILNLFGIRKAARVDFGLVIFKIAILLVFFVFALFYTSTTHWAGLANLSFSDPANNLSAIFASSVAIFFAYSGFQAISNLTSRINGGAKAAAKAILASVVISVVLYVMVLLALLVLLPASSYKINADPLAFALNKIRAPSTIVILVDIGAIIATVSAAIATMLTASLTSYQMSEDKLLPSSLRKFNKKKDVAANDVILSAAIGIIMLFSGNIYTIAAISNFGLLFSYLMASLAALHFRQFNKSPGFRAPFYPYLPIVTIVALLAFMYGMPQISLVIGVTLILGLIIIYYTLREIEKKRVVKLRLFK